MSLGSLSSQRWSGLDARLRNFQVLILLKLSSCSYLSPRCPAPQVNWKVSNEIPGTLRTSPQARKKNTLAAPFKKKPAAAQCSRLVTHVNTLWPLRCLSARIGRDAEGSSRYGRRWKWGTGIAISKARKAVVKWLLRVLKADWVGVGLTWNSRFGSC